MELYQLEYFKAVAECGSFTKAASRMNVSQPTISIAIQKLEKELGVSLFEKKDGHVLLTEMGGIVASRAKSILFEIENIYDEIKDNSEHNDFTIRLGMPLTLCSDLLLPLKTRFSAVFPNGELQITQYGIEFLEVGLKEGDFDYCILAMPIEDSKINYREFRKIEMGVCFQQGHPLSPYQTIVPSMLEDEVLIIPEKPEGISKCIRDYLEAQKVPGKQYIAGVLVPQAMLEFAGQGIGIAFVEKYFASSYKNIECRTLSPPLVIQLVIAWNRCRYVSKFHDNLISFFLSQAKDAANCGVSIPKRTGYPG